MSRPSWHRQAGLEAAVKAVRPDLDHEVRVDMMLGIALALPGHHIPPVLSLGGLAARRTSSSAHRVSTSYKCAQRVHDSAPSIEEPRVENVMAACASHAGMRPYISGSATVASRPRLAVPVGRSAGSRHFVLKTLQFKTLCLTQACTIPTEKSTAHTTARCTQKRPSSAPHPKSAPKPNGGGGE